MDRAWKWLALTLLLLPYLHIVISVDETPLLLVLSLDGFRHDLYDNYSTPNLHKIAAEGVRAPWIKNVFVTNTLPNHFSIATGLYPESHGFVDNAFFDPDEGAFIDYYNETFEPHQFKINGVPLWILNQEQTSRHSGCVMWPGSDLTFRDRQAFHVLSRNATITFNVTTFTDEIALTISYFTNDSYPANVVFLYREQPDLLSHHRGPYSKEVRDAVVVLDLYIGDLVEALQKAGLYDRMNIIITGDHGQEQYTTDGIRTLDQVLTSDLYDMDGDDGVTLRIRPKEGNLELVYEMLKNHTWNEVVYDVYKKEDIPKEWHYTNHPRISPILLVARRGFFLQQTHKPSLYGDILGTHGYPNTHHSMYPLFLARGPSFRKGYESEPFDLVHIYSLMCHLLGLEPAPNNGSLDAVRHLLKEEESLLERVTPLKSSVLIAVSVIISLLLVAVLFIIVRRTVVRRNRPRVHEE